MRKDIATVCMTDSNSGWNDNIGKIENVAFNNTIFGNTTLEKRAHRKKAKTNSFQQTKKKTYDYL